MARNHNTDRNGSSFGKATIDAVWNKATIVPGVNPNLKRKDGCYAWIEYSQYGNTAENGTGWEIDHIIPVSRGGSDSLSNLQPLQWQNNRHKGDDYPSWGCLVKAAT